MGLMLIWRLSNPRAEKAFYKIIIMHDHYHDHAVGGAFQIAAYAFPLVRIDVFLSGSFLQKKTKS